MGPMRVPAVAGSFYPGRPGELAAAVKGYLAEAATDQATAAPKAIIVPHAGYIYSAPVAAAAYARLTPLAGTVTRVVLLGPAHTVYLSAVAAPHAIHCSGSEPLRYLAIDCFPGARPAAEPTWDDHVRTVCRDQGWDYDQVLEK